MNKMRIFSSFIIFLACLLIPTSCATSRNTSNNIPETQEEKTELKTEDTLNQRPLHAPIVVKKRLP